MNTRAACLALAFALLPVSYGAAALDTTVNTKIVLVENGWFGEGLALVVTPGTGKPGCAAPENMFAIDAGHPSYKVLVAMAMTAVTTGATVQMVVAPGECIFGARTRVVSIRLQS